MEKIIEFIITKDGSNTLYSKEYSQHYHNCNDGALQESLTKHIIPAFSYIKLNKTLNILDICFGLGYNTLATLYYIQKYNLNIKVNIFSPELNKELLQNLIKFEYPKEFKKLLKIIDSITNHGYYKDKMCNIEVYNGDAREYLKQLKEKNIQFDIVYQDPFSADVNKALWSVEYFKDIYSLLDQKGIVTTYSIATPVRLSMSEAGLKIYEIKNDTQRKSTIALKIQSDNFKYIDMELKKQRNPNAKALRDNDNKG